MSTTVGVHAVIRRVKLADSLNRGRLADGDQAGSPQRLHCTQHETDTRSVQHFDGTQSPFPIVRVRCLDCETVFTVLPSFVVRYKREDTDAIEKLMVLLFSTEDS